MCGPGSDSGPLIGTVNVAVNSPVNRPVIGSVVDNVEPTKIPSYLISIAEPPLLAKPTPVTVTSSPDRPLFGETVIDGGSIV